MMDDDKHHLQTSLLDYLVIKNGLHPPSSLMAIQFRQCSVVRWLLARGCLDADDIMLETDLLVYSELMSLEFELPIEFNPQMTDKKFLSFLATVQYDDIQTLEFLLGSYGPGIIGHEGFGFNLVDATAHFGRIEIMYYISNLPPFASLVMEAVGSGKYQGWFASHIAVSNAYITIADLLLSGKCPIVDLNDRSVSLIASESSHTFVKNWTLAILESTQLESDVNMLLELVADISLPLASLEEHVAQSQCMDIQSWINLGCSTLDEKGKLPFSFRSVILQCVRLGATDLSLWITVRVILKKNNGVFFHKETNSDSVVMISCLDFEGILGDLDLAQCGHSSWATGTEVRDHHTNQNPFVELFDKSSQRGLTAMITKIAIIQGLYSKCLDEFERLLFASATERALRELIPIPGVLNAKLLQEGAEPYDDKNHCLSQTGKVKLQWKARINGKATKQPQRIKKYSLFPIDLERLYALISLDGDAGVIRLCFEHQCNLTANSEIIMTYLASCLKRKDLIEVFLGEIGAVAFESSIDDCWIAAAGATDCGDLLEMHDYLDRIPKNVPEDLLKSKYEELVDNRHFLKRMDTLELEPEATKGVSTDIQENTSLCSCFRLIGRRLVRTMLVGKEFGKWCSF